jgi:hypothetical protein
MRLPQMAREIAKASLILFFWNLHFITLYVVGDFGLATSSLAAVDPSDVSPVLVTPDADMTLGMAFSNSLSFHDVS